MKQLLSVGVLCAFTVLANLPAFAAEEKGGEEKKANQGKAIVFRGKVGAVDKQAKTLKIGERTFQITAETKIIKAGKAATLEDAMVGEEVGGQYRAVDGGKLEALSVRLGPKPVETPKPQEDKKDTR